MLLSGKHIVIGIGSGIAAYKIPELIRLLRKQGAEVKVATTRHALEFVTDLTLQTLSGHRVYSDVFAAINDHSTEHISLPDWADAMLVAPATADVLCKMAAGIADDALTTTLAAMRKPVVVAPAMNDKMYAAEALQDALCKLAGRTNIHVLDCADGFLACGTNGKGRMQEPEVLVEAVRAALTPQDWQGRRVLVTCGPTREAIDPVRFISNHSTGKMGIALVSALVAHGATVRLVAGPVQQPLILPLWHPAMTHYGSCRRTDVTSADEMYNQATEAWQTADTAILAAAVADMTPAQVADHKMKKGQDNLDILRLTETQDIARALGETKRPNQQLIGFALETDHEQVNALDKLHKKHLDAIVLNSLRDAGAGFGTDTNIVTIYNAEGCATHIPLADKSSIAEAILAAISR